MVALAIVLWIGLFGYTPFELANEALVICGFVSLAIAAFNLLPFKPLDGFVAWQIFPAAMERGGLRNKQKNSEWRSYR